MGKAIGPRTWLAGEAQDGSIVFKVLAAQKVCSVITISDDTNRYDSLAEMKHHIGSRIKNFNISGENPKVHFLLNKARLRRCPAVVPVRR
jgi:hypothetical protein